MNKITLLLNFKQKESNSYFYLILLNILNKMMFLFFFVTAHAYSVNTVQSVGDYIISEHLLAGQRMNGRMSNVRRFFCLFVTFDILFTSLMWIICVMVSVFKLSSKKE